MNGSKVACWRPGLSSVQLWGDIPHGIREVMRGRLLRELFLVGFRDFLVASECGVVPP